MDTALLRVKLHEAVDEIVDDLLSRTQNGASAAAAGEDDVQRVGSIEAFDYNWPADYGTEHFDSGTLYKLSALTGEATAIVAWTVRNAWGRDRRRAVVFHRMRHDDQPGRWYPWTEFVETDTGRYAASVPNPDRPRAIARDVTRLPARFTGRTVMRSDAVFDSIREGGSLRLVLDESDEAEMVRHGYWVATLRGRV